MKKQDLLFVGLIVFVLFIWLGSSVFIILFQRHELVKLYGEMFTNVVQLGFSLGWIPLVFVMELHNLLEKKKEG